MKICGAARIGNRTKHLVRKLLPGDIAVIRHRDIDEVAALSLIDCRVGAVINIDSSITGNYPNNGPLKLWEAKIWHLDQVGEKILGEIKDGDILVIRDDSIWRGKKKLARGRIVSSSLIRKKTAEAENNLDKLLDSFVQNTLEYALREKELILGGVELPVLETDFRDRHALIVVRGRLYREDLRAIRNYIRDVKPVLVAVDGGADALLEYGYRPDLVVGDMDSVSDRGLCKAKELVVHAYPDGRAPGLERIKSLGLPAKIMRAPGTSEDIAMLLAYEYGAALIAAVGTHSSMIDFLEKGRKGMASTFLVRLKVGWKLVDARGVSRLYRGKFSPLYLLVITLSAALCALVLAVINPTVGHVFRLLVMRLRLFM